MAGMFFPLSCFISRWVHRIKITASPQLEQDQLIKELFIDHTGVPLIPCTPCIPGAPGGPYKRNQN